VPLVSPDVVADSLLSALFTGVSAAYAQFPSDAKARFSLRMSLWSRISPSFLDTKRRFLKDTAGEARATADVLS
jgi:hypothetical protein